MTSLVRRLSLHRHYAGLEHGDRPPQLLNLFLRTAGRWHERMCPGERRGVKPPGDRQAQAGGAHSRKNASGVGWPAVSPPSGAGAACRGARPERGFPPRVTRQVLAAGTTVGMGVPEGKVLRAKAAHVAKGEEVANDQNGPMNTASH